MDQLIILATAIIFYFIGRYSRHPLDTEALLKKAKQLIHRPKGGMVINYPTAAEIEYEKSGEKEVDEAREKAFKEAGIV